MPASTSRKRKQEERNADERKVKHRVRSKTVGSRKPEPTDFTQLFKVLQKKDAIATDRESHLFRKRREFEAVQQERNQLLKRREKLEAELARSRTLDQQLQAAGEELVAAIEADKQSAKLDRDELVGLRFWGVEVVLTDLPRELLPSIFQYLGYVHQQRLVRVCRLWKHIITSEIDSIYVDVMMLLAFHVNANGAIVRNTAKGARSAGDRFRNELAKGSVERSERQCDWKYQCPGVRSVVFDGMYLVELYYITDSVLALAERFPSLSALNLTRLKLNGLGLQWIGQKLHQFADARTSVRLTVGQSVTMALCGTRMVQSRCCSTYVEVPDAVITPGQKVSGYSGRLDGGNAVWPYPPSQIEWLAKYAGYFNENKRVMNVLRKAMAVCEEHHLFCQHLDISFYTDKLCGRDRNLLALNILLIGIPNMEPSPVPFRFKRLEVNGGRLRLLPEV